MWHRLDGRAAAVLVLLGACSSAGPVGSGPARGEGPSGRVAYGRVSSPESRIFVLDPATGRSHSIPAPSGASFVASWSPDGASIAFIAERDGGARYAIVVTRADGTHPVTIVDHPKVEGAAGPDVVSLSWSPDGRRIAYSGRAPGRGRTVSIINADGTGARLLDGLWVSVSWSPDGQRLLVDGYPTTEDHFDLYTMRIDGSDLRRLTNDAQVERGATWSPDGKRVVFSSAMSEGAAADYEQDVYVMNVDAADRVRITTWEGLDFFPVWSPDGEWVAFSSDRDATPGRQSANRRPTEMFRGLSIYAARPDGSETQRLLSVGDATVVPLSWTT